MGPFRDAEAIRRWEGFKDRLEGALADLPSDEQMDLRTELRGHVLDAYAEGDPALSETDRLDAALARLGDPMQFLQPLRTDRYLAEAIRGVRPVALARGLLGMVAEGGRAALTGVAFVFLYVALAVFAAMALLKPIFPDRLGLFRYPDGQVDFGFVSARDGGVDVLGLWAMPVGLVLTLLCWLLLNQLLRRTRARR